MPKKISQFPVVDETGLTDTDLVPVVADASGSPATSRITFQNLSKFLRRRVPSQQHPKNDTMQGLLAELTDADTTIKKIVVLGDSISEDWQHVDIATTETANLRSWVRKFEEDLAYRFHHGRVGSGWLPIRQVLGTVPGWTTCTGSLDITKGLGQMATQLDAGEYAEVAVTCDGFDLYIDSIGSTLEVRVDGGLVATLTASAVPTVYNSGALLQTSHTIRVTAAGGTAYPYAGYFHNGTRASGVQLHNGGHSSWGPTDHLTKRGSLEHIALVQPDAVIVALGAAQGANGGYDSGVTTCTANIEALMNAIAVEAPDATLICVAQHAFTGRSATWPPFVESFRELCATNGWGFIDCNATIGYTGGDPRALTLVDDVHLNVRGFRLMADTVLEAIVGNTDRSGANLVRTTTADDLTITHSRGVQLFFREFITTVAIGLRRSGDTNDRAVFADGSLSFGPGSALIDASISRTGVGVLNVSTGKLQLTTAATVAADALNLGTADTRYTGSDFVDATRFFAVTGTPALAAYGTDLGVAMAFDAAAVEKVVATIDVPSAWLTFRIDAIWTNLGAGAGNVVWASEVRFHGDGDDFDAVAADTETMAAVAAPAQDVTEVTIVGTTVTRTASKFVTVHIERTGTSGSDTLANDAGLIGLNLVRLT